MDHRFENLDKLYKEREEKEAETVKLNLKYKEEYMHNEMLKLNSDKISLESNIRNRVKDGRISKRDES